jgi:acyl-CoA reductase-like NAD-dependent aldehyde dehydrogenase
MGAPADDDSESMSSTDQGSTTTASSGTPLEIWSPVTGECEDVREPSSTEAIPELVERARHAQESWSGQSFKARAAVLNAVVDRLADEAEEIAEHIHYFNGKTTTEAILAEVFPTLATFRYFAKVAHKHLRPKTIKLSSLPFAHSKLHRDPLGVVGVIAPWNYPFKLMLQDVPAALMAGNAVIIKVSEHSTAIGERAQKLLEDAGVPDNLVQFIYGYGDLGAALIAGGIDKVCFTGSTATGRKVYEAAARAMIPCGLELGGKDAAIVLDDADLDDAARGVMWAAFANCGQTCASVELVYVPRDMGTLLVDKLRVLIEKLPEGSVGTMNAAFQKDRVQAQLDEAYAQGAQMIAESPQGDTEHPFRLNPVLLVDVSKNCELYREETFGPVLPVFGYSDLEEVIEEVNGSPYGLTTSIWTKDRSRGEQLARRIDSGAVTINEHMITPGMPEAPWGGRKLSGLGSSMSHLALHGFSKVKYVFHDRGLVKYKFWRYPFTADKARWIRSFLSAEFGKTIGEKIGGMIKAMPRLLTKRNPRYEE